MHTIALSDVHSRCRSAAGIAVLTDGDTGSTVRVSQAHHADQLLARTLPPPELVLLRGVRDLV